MHGMDDFRCKSALSEFQNLGFKIFFFCVGGGGGGGDSISLNLCLPKSESNVLHSLSRVERVRLKLLLR